MEGYATSREVADYLNVRPNTLDRWASDGTGPKFTRINGRRRYRWADIREYAGERPFAQAGPALNCQICKKSVASAGYVRVSHADVNKARAARERRDEYFAEKKRRLGNFAGSMIEGREEWDLVPHPAQWTVLHRACDPDPEGSAYWYEVDRIDTYPKFLSFIAHVSGKGWVRDHTDLPSLIRRAIGE